MLGFTIHRELDQHTLECNTYFQVNWAKLTHADLVLHLRQLLTEKALKVYTPWLIGMLKVELVVFAFLPSDTHCNATWCTAAVSLQFSAPGITAFPLHNASETWS